MNVFQEHFLKGKKKTTLKLPYNILPLCKLPLAEKFAALLI